MRRVLSQEEEQQVLRLARLISDSLDAALIENNVITASQCVPYDQANHYVKESLNDAARNVYMNLHLVRGFGTIHVNLPVNPTGT